MIQLPTDFKEFLKLLNEAAVDYLLIGGYAVGIHGYVRATSALDIWLRASPDTASKIVDVLHAFGFPKDSLPAGWGSQKSKMLRIGFPPLRIELLTTISGIEFAVAFPRRIVVEAEGMPLSVIGREDLKANKAASGRKKDLADIENLGL